MDVKAAWAPYTEHGKLSHDEKKEKLPESVFAFPKERKEPLTDASHVRDALARFDQVEGMTNQERSLAWANLLAAARYCGLDVRETGWHELGEVPQKPIPGHERHSEQ